jgi:formylglycine-generating enzyme required for sulfatase activity
LSRLDIAEEYYNKLIKIDPSDGSAWAMLGAVLAKEYKLEEAKIAIEKARRLVSETSEVKEAYNIYEEEEEKLKNAPEGMIYIPAGWFWMGCSPNDKQGGDNEKPYHKVYLDGYYIDKYPVTNEQYKKFCDATGHKYPKYWKKGLFSTNDLPDKLRNHPVVDVSWNDIQEYCKWAGKELPTEAQWEKAARGTDGRIYPWGNGWDASKACYKQSSTCAVGSYPQGASPYGVMDMAGNVWEWCRDWYDANYYANSPDHNPTGPDSGKSRVVRGGSCFTGDPGGLRVSGRIPGGPSVGGEIDSGFRCIRQVSK